MKALETRRFAALSDSGRQVRMVEYVKLTEGKTHFLTADGKSAEQIGAGVYRLATGLVVREPK